MGRREGFELFYAFSLYISLPSMRKNVDSRLLTYVPILTVTFSNLAHLSSVTYSKYRDIPPGQVG